MSADFNSTRKTPGEANDEMMGVRFIDLEEITDEQEVDEQAIKCVSQGKTKIIFSSVLLDTM